jgi:hypothetical protein
MPLTDPGPRREVHHRVIDMRAYACDDGTFEVEAHLVDRKPFDFPRLSAPEPLPAGSPLHDLWVRLRIGPDLVVLAVEAASDVTPWALCREAEATLSVLVGERLERGWSTTVKSRLRGSASCTHLMEMLLPAATTALQGIRGLSPGSRRQQRNADGVPVQIGTCYAYAAHREVVRRIWPEHARPERDP